MISQPGMTTQRHPPTDHHTIRGRDLSHRPQHRMLHRFQPRTRDLHRSTRFQPETLTLERIGRQHHPPTGAGHQRGPVHPDTPHEQLSQRLREPWRGSPWSRRSVPHTTPVTPASSRVSGHAGGQHRMRADLHKHPRTLARPAPGSPTRTRRYAADCDTSTGRRSGRSPSRRRWWNTRPRWERQSWAPSSSPSSSSRIASTSAVWEA